MNRGAVLLYVCEQVYFVCIIKNETKRKDNEPVRATADVSVGMRCRDDF